MPPLLVVSPEPLAGKTTVIAGLAQRFRGEGRPVVLERMSGDEHAEVDGRLLGDIANAKAAGAASASEIVLIEAPAGDPAAAVSAQSAARVIVVATPSTPAGTLREFLQPIAERVSGVVMNRVSRRSRETARAELEANGIHVIAMVDEDRLLAAPVLRDVAAALSATVEHVDGHELRPVDRPMIAAISADPGQGYFVRYDAKAVVVRSDKPDLQLAALNAGASCIIATGGLPILSYVLERAEEDEIPLVRTALDTVGAVRAIEELFGNRPFAGGPEKIQRIGELLADADWSGLAEA